MPNFKPKTTKKIEVDFRSSITLDGKHNDILNEIYKEEVSILEYDNLHFS